MLVTDKHDNIRDYIIRRSMELPFSIYNLRVCHFYLSLLPFLSQPLWPMRCMRFEVMSHEHNGIFDNTEMYTNVLIL